MSRACALSLIGLMVAGLFAPTAMAQPSISWTVHNRFRLFEDSAAVIRKENALLAILVQYPDLKTAYPHYYPYLQAAPQPTADDPNLYDHTRYNRLPGDYSPVRYGDQPYAIPLDQPIDFTLNGVTDPAARCDWYLDRISIAKNVPCNQAIVPAVATYAKGQFSYSGVADVYPAGAAISTATRLATAAVQTGDTLIASMGDSYAAGEGSPDRPADVSKMQPARPSDGLGYTWWRAAPKLFQSTSGALPEAASADWWSIECHRSLFSPHVIAALKIAAADPHRSVTYLSYACAGASVLDGLLTPQASPPGVTRIDGMAAESNNGDGIEGQAQTTSQLERAVTDLCVLGKVHEEPYDFEGKHLKNWMTILYDRAGEDDPDTPVCDEYQRQPSLVFLTIGGNDVGFAGLAAWALTPTDMVPASGLSREQDDRITELLSIAAGDLVSWNGLAIVCPSTPYPSSSDGQTGDPRCRYYDPNATNQGGAKELISELPDLMISAKDFFHRSHLIDHAVVIQEAYPSPLTDQNGLVCGTSGPGDEFANVAQLQEPWLAQKALLPSLLHLNEDEIYVRPDAAQAVKALAFDQTPGAASLFGVLQRAQEPGWILAGPPDFSKDGICAGDGPARFTADFGFPLANSPATAASGFWVTPPGGPATWQAYAHRARWLRTANDSLLTEAASLQNGDILDEALGGTMHPTAEGQAAVADAIVGAIPPTALPH